MIPPLPRLSDYDVSPQHGFLPAELPLEILPDSYYGSWETIIRNLQALVLSKRLRPLIDGMPVLSTEHLVDEAEWRRAYVILGFMAHAYIWGGETPREMVPPTISIPFLECCRHLELPPVATYAGLCLWNWKPLFLSEAIDSLDNLSTLHTFTGSLDESWFYLISVAIEARGAPIVPMMLDAMAAVRHNDSRVVTECLRAFAERLDELGTLLTKMYDNCDPHVFYRRIRPFLAGSKNMVEAGLPNGVLFDDGTGLQPFVQYSGGSNAQSSIIQFFDLVLGVQHRPTGDKASTGAPSHNFIKDMRTYMPGPHRRFLEQIERTTNIRDYVESRQSNRALVTAFDAALAMLRAFRDKHIQMVSRYIIVPSKQSPKRRDSTAIKPEQPIRKVNLASAEDKGAPRGTGGTALIPFLKQARDETGEPAIDEWAGRLMNRKAGDFGTGRVASLTKMGEHGGEAEIVGLAGTWSINDSEGGICHW